MHHINIPCPDLDEALSFFTERLGFRIDMVMPADDPAVAVISGHDLTIRLEESAKAAKLSEPPASAGGGEPANKSVGPQSDDYKPTPDPTQFTITADDPDHPLISLADDAKWVKGRAGMEYRDLIPGRLGGLVAASQIRLPAAGVVPDYVHYHKVRFQLIYCWRGKVKVVYEDIGEPFWLHPGDCVLQPPEIRHRVLECGDGTEVIELTSPAVHETWADHEMRLPTGSVLKDRDFAGQRFILHRGVDSTPVLGEFGDFAAHNTGIHSASAGAAHVIALRTLGAHATTAVAANSRAATFYFILNGRLELTAPPGLIHHFTTGDAVTLPAGTAHRLNASPNSEILCVRF